MDSLMPVMADKVKKSEFSFCKEMDYETIRASVNARNGTVRGVCSLVADLIHSISKYREDDRRIHPAQFIRTLQRARLLVLAHVLRVQPVAGFFVMGGVGSKTEMPTKEHALQGRTETVKVSAKHTVNGNTTVPPFPEDTKFAMFGLGCFWGAESKFWQQSDIFSTQVGYSSGFSPNPTYEEVCSGKTGHNEVVRVVYNPSKIPYSKLLKVFWESHNPTTLNRQGNDMGTQYRSGIYYYDDQQKQEAEQSRDLYQAELKQLGHGEITTEIMAATEFYYAEDYHQQYLDKNAEGYCGLGGTGVACPIGLGKKNKDKEEL